MAYMPDKGAGQAVDNRYERNWERSGRWGDADREYRDKNFQYRQDRDAIGDQQWYLDRSDGINRDRIGPDGEDADLPLELRDRYERRNRGVIDDGSDDGFDLSDAQAYYQPASMRRTDNPRGGRYEPSGSLVQNESGGNWRARNNAKGAGGKRGHFGRIQFGHARLEDAKRAGVIPANMTPEQFMASPRAQQATERWHFWDIDREAARRGLNEYVGRTIGGARITPEAIRAMAHLGGIKGAERFLKSGGRHNPRDENGTSLRDYAIRHGGGGRSRRTVNAARGGLIEPLDEEELPTQEVAQAIPTPDEAPRPMPRPEYEGGQEGTPPSDDPVTRARNAVKEGMEWAMKQSQSDFNAPIDDPQMEQRRQNYIRGYGAAPQQLLRQAMDLVDPNKEMTDARRSLMAIGVVHDFYSSRGEYEKAQAAAGTMVQAERQASQQMWALSQAAASNGDIDKAVKAAVAAYANIPNGIDMQVSKLEDGNYEITFEGVDGQTISKEVMDPKRIAEMAMNFSPGTYDTAILDAAGIAAASRSERSVSDLASIDESVGAEMEGMQEELESLGLNANQTREFRRVVNDIASDVEANGMTPSDAQTFALRLIQFPEGDLSSDAAPFEIREERGGDVATVIDKRTGERVRMSINAARNLAGLRENIQQKRMAEYEDGQKPGYVRRVGEVAGKALEATGDTIRHALTPKQGSVPRSPAIDTEEYSLLQEEEQRLRYAGYSDGDPEIQEILGRLRELEEQSPPLEAVIPEEQPQQGGPSREEQTRSELEAAANATKDQIQRLRAQGVRMSDPRMKDLLRDLQQFGGAM